MVKRHYKGGEDSVAEPASAENSLSNTLNAIKEKTTELFSNASEWVSSKLNKDESEQPPSQPMYGGKRMRKRSMRKRSMRKRSMRKRTVRKHKHTSKCNHNSKRSHKSKY